MLALSYALNIFSFSFFFFRLTTFVDVRFRRISALLHLCLCEIWSDHSSMKKNQHEHDSCIYMRYERGKSQNDSFELCITSGCVTVNYFVSREEWVGARFFSNRSTLTLPKKDFESQGSNYLDQAYQSHIIFTVI